MSLGAVLDLPKVPCIVLGLPEVLRDVHVLLESLELSLATLKSLESSIMVFMVFCLMSLKSHKICILPSRLKVCTMIAAKLCTNKYIVLGI